ncbi:MAG: Methylamine utilization protein, partial [Ignavibacteria bacterium]
RITVLLFLVFFLFAVYGTAIGINEDCGCFGSVLRSEFGWMMIVRNAVLLTISIIVTKKIANKSPGAGQKQTNKPIK